MLIIGMMSAGIIIIVDVVTQKLTTAISINIYNEEHKDIGVASGNVSIGFLDAMLNEFSNIDGQESYFINADGFFCNQPRPDAVLKKDFFAKKNFEHYRAELLATKNSFMQLKGDSLFYAVFIPDVDWYLVSIILSHIIFSQVNRVALSTILLSVLAGIAVIALSFFASRTLVA